VTCESASPIPALLRCEIAVSAGSLGSRGRDFRGNGSAGGASAVDAPTRSSREHRWCRVSLARMRLGGVATEGLQEEMVRVLAENDTLRRERASLTAEVEDWRAERDFLSVLSPLPPTPSCLREHRAGGRVHTPSRVAPPVGRHQLHPQGSSTYLPPHTPHTPHTPYTASPQPRQWCDAVRPPSSMALTRTRPWPSAAPHVSVVRRI